MVGTIARFLIALNSNSRPGEMASAMAFGLWLALIPGGNLLWTALFIAAFFLRNNTAAYLIFLGLFRLVVPLFDGLLDFLGYLVLTSGPLEGIFTFLYNLPLFSYTEFNNTLVMGGFLLGLLLWVPFFYLFRILIIQYRKHAAPKIASSRWMKALKKLPVISRIGKALAAEVRF